VSNLAAVSNSKLSKEGARVLKSYSGEHRSKKGYIFTFEKDRWIISGDKTLGFENLPDADEDFWMGGRAALSRYAEELSDNHTKNMLAHTKKYLTVTGERKITIEGLSKFRNTLGPKDEWVLGAVKGFWLSMYDWGLPGIDKETANVLEELTLAGNEKGAAVLRRCPYTGPLTELEQSALLEWAVNALNAEDEANRITLEEYAYLLSLLYTGRRSVQVLCSRFGDLSIEESSDGNNYKFNMPRAKQHGIGFREEFNEIPIDEDLYQVLRGLVNQSVNKIEELFGKKMPPQIKDTLPLFIHWGRMKKADGYEGYLACIKETPDHFQSTQADRFLKKIARKSTALSERTGDYIQLSSRRFRYTKGTNLYNLGISGISLAWALDHSDNQSIGVYTENTPKTAEIIDEVVSEALAPIAQACAGTLIDSERDALRGDDPRSRVKNDRSSSVGSCGTYEFCAFGHRPCYACKHFQPWRDAPHHEVLEDLLEERKRQAERGVSAKVIQSTDRLLLAVQYVIHMCKEIEIEMAEEKTVNG
jgi:hypothetical protein